MNSIKDIDIIGVQMDLGVASAESWIYFGVALLFIGISSIIILGAVKSYE